MKKTLLVSGLLLATIYSAIFWLGCKKKSDSNSSSGDVALVIQSGAQTVEPGGTMSYSAIIVDSKGNATPATNATWTVSGEGGSAIGAFSGNLFTGSGSGYGTITASASIGGKTITASVPIGVYTPALFTVVPSAIVWSTNAGVIPLMPVYIGTSTVSGYTYSSSNTAVATVSAAGDVSFVSIGSALITVTATGLSGNNKVYIPVLVVGVPSVPLPVVRVAVTPGGANIFRGDIANFTAKAYNSSGSAVSANFMWVSTDPSVASVDATGKVIALQLGSTVITATSNGITGQAEVQVLPDTSIIVTPYTASLSADAYKQFTAQAYVVNHSNYSVSPIAMPAGLTWEMPYTGGYFDIATVSNTGLVHMKATSTTPLLSTIVMAHVSSPTIDPGVGLVIVSDCNCGTTTPGVDHITVTSPTLTISLMGGPATIVASAVTASGTSVPGATLTFCSDNIVSCSVDPTTPGVIVPTAPGTATITICNGGVQTTVTVTVTL
jgi:hypothetical protein